MVGPLSITFEIRDFFDKENREYRKFDENTKKRGKLSENDGGKGKYRFS